MSVDQPGYPQAYGEAERAAYDKGFDDGFSDGANDAAPGLLEAAKALLRAWPPEAILSGLLIADRVTALREAIANVEEGGKL